MDPKDKREEEIDSDEILEMELEEEGLYEMEDGDEPEERLELENEH